MKKVMWLLAVVLIASLSLYASPVLAGQGNGHGFGYGYGHAYGHDNDCTGDGDCARDYIEIAPKGKNAEIPASHFMIIAKYMNELLSVPASPTSYWNIIAAPLFDGVDDPALNDEISDFFVVDIRTPAQYCAGHLPTAVNIPVTDLGKPENLALLPFDKAILLVCNSGHNASVAEGVLRILGYDAWALRGGMLAITAVTPGGFPLASPTVKLPVYGIVNDLWYPGLQNRPTLATCTQ